MTHIPSSDGRACPSGHDHEGDYESAVEQVSRIRTLIDHALIVVKFIHADEDDDDPTPVVYACDPFKPSRGYPIMLLPTKEYQMYDLANSKVQDAVGEFANDEKMSAACAALKVKAVLCAMGKHEDFRNRVLMDPACTGENGIEATFEAYLDFFNLRDGGDFHSPLE